MKFKETPREHIQADNTIIDYYNGKAIISNEWGNLFFVEMPKEYAIIGEVVETKDLTSIDELPEKEQQEIISFLLSEE